MCMTRNILKPLQIASLSAAVLTNCQSSDTPEDISAQAATAQSPSFTPIATLGTGPLQSGDLQAATDNLTVFQNGTNITGAIVGNIPTHGTASYNGTISINKTTQNDPSTTPSDLYHGRIQINADFASTTINGAMGDFGHLTASTSPTLNPVSGFATFSGTITDQNSSSTPGKTIQSTDVAGFLDGEVISGTLTGQFYTVLTTNQRIITGSAALNIGSDVDTSTTYLATE